MTSEQPSSEDTLLTSLCLICHVSPQKYTCPRCNIHTCSLACVQTHKRRSLCTGIRDPAAYRRRNELATASSIDADFNFISGVERGLSRLEEEEKDKMTLKPSGGGYKTDSRRLEEIVRDCGVTWRRAPKGMARRKENETQIVHGRVSWTVEFIEEGGRMFGLVPDEKTLDEAWTLVRTRKQKSGNKRRRSQGEGGQKPAKKARVAQQDTLPEQEPDRYFYLLRPNTPSKIKVLRPIEKTEKVIDVLSNQTVMEYPTVYVKDQPPDQLQPPFTSEERYLSEYGEDVTVPDKKVEEEEEGEIREEPTVPEEVIQALQDPSKLLSVLQADLKT